MVEVDCARFARDMGYPVIPCDLCGSRDGLRRAQIIALLDKRQARHPGRRQVMARALANARPSHLADPGPFDFAGLWPARAH